MAAQEDPLLTAEQAALLAGRSAATIRRWWQEGRLAFVDTDRSRRSHRRVHRSVLLETLATEGLAGRPAEQVPQASEPAALSAVDVDSMREATRALRAAADAALSAAVRTAEGAEQAARAQASALREVQVMLRAYDDALSQVLAPRHPEFFGRGDSP